MEEATAARPTVRVELGEEFPGLWADCDADPTWGLLEGIGSTDIRVITTSLVEIVQGWNFKARDGKPAPVSIDAIRKLPARQIGGLLKAYSSSFNELPKESGGS